MYFGIWDYYSLMNIYCNYGIMTCPSAETLWYQRNVIIWIYAAETCVFTTWMIIWLSSNSHRWSPGEFVWTRHVRVHEFNILLLVFVEVMKLLIEEADERGLSEGEEHRHGRRVFVSIVMIHQLIYFLMTHQYVWLVDVVWPRYPGKDDVTAVLSTGSSDCPTDAEHLLMDSVGIRSQTSTDVCVPAVGVTDSTRCHCVVCNVITPESPVTVLLVWIQRC